MQTSGEREREVDRAEAHERCVEIIERTMAESRAVRRSLGRRIRVARLGCYASPTQLAVPCTYWPRTGPTLMPRLDRVAITVIGDMGMPTSIQLLHWNAIEALAADYLSQPEGWPGWVIVSGPLPAGIKERLVAFEIEASGT